MRGQTVTLWKRTEGEPDAFGNPTYTEEAVTVENVLIGEPTTDDITSSATLYGKQIRFMLGIPKGDPNNWENRKVSWVDSYGRTVTTVTFGFPITGVEANIPGPWHMKVRCGDYE